MTTQEFSSIADIRAHLPERATLLPFFKGGKSPGVKDWPRLSYEQTQENGFKLSLFHREISYAKMLRGAERNGGNVGVVLGQASNGLHAIDVDSEQGLTDLLAANESLRGTLITARKRGGQVWFQEPGQSVGLTALKTVAGEAWGELRGDGGMSVLHGEAKDKRKGETEPTRYHILNKAKPVVLAVESIQWPSHVAPPVLRASTDVLPPPAYPPSSVSLGLCVPGSLGSGYLGHKAETTVAENLAMQAKAEAFLEVPAHAGVKKLYERFIGPKFSAMAGRRNGFIVEAMPFLYRVVSPSIAVTLSLLHLALNKAQFAASPEEHMKQSQAHLAAIARTYTGELSDDEAEAYAAMDERGQLVFRLCRDFALYEDSEKPKEPLTFFASFAGLSERTGLQREQLSRIVRKFIGAGVLECVEKGTMFCASSQAAQRRASVYRWRLPVPINEVNELARSE